MFVCMDARPSTCAATMVVPSWTVEIRDGSQIFEGPATTTTHSWEPTRGKAGIWSERNEGYDEFLSFRTTRWQGEIMLVFWSRHDPSTHLRSRPLACNDTYRYELDPCIITVD